MVSAMGIRFPTNQCQPAIGNAISWALLESNLLEENNIQSWYENEAYALLERELDIQIIRNPNNFESPWHRLSDWEVEFRDQEHFIEWFLRWA